MHCNPDTVDLLYAALTSPQTFEWDAGDPSTWRIGGRPLTPAEVQQVRNATSGDWDAHDLLLSVDRHLIAVRRDDVHARMRAVGLPCDLPPVQ